MSRKLLLSFVVLALVSGLVLFMSGCGAKVEADPKLEAPPPAVVERESDASLFKVDHPEQYPLVTAGEYNAAPELDVTGTVSADISRNIPVISLASGRIIEVHAKLGDSVQKGQLLLKIQSSDISGAYSDYQQALADEKLAQAQLDRSKVLYEKGAVAKKDLEVAEDAEAKAEPEPIKVTPGEPVTIPQPSEQPSTEKPATPEAAVPRDGRHAGGTYVWLGGVFLLLLLMIGSVAANKNRQQSSGSTP